MRLRGKVYRNQLSRFSVELNVREVNVKSDHFFFRGSNQTNKLAVLQDLVRIFGARNRAGKVADKRERFAKAEGILFNFLLLIVSS